MLSDDELLVLPEVEQRRAIVSRLTVYLCDPRGPSQLCHDAVNELAIGQLPEGGDLYSQTTISRLDDWQDALTLLRIWRATVDNCFQVPRVTRLDVDDKLGAERGGWKWRLFAAPRAECHCQ